MAGQELLPDRKESWRRIRVGLTGLGGILLIIGLASAMLERVGPGRTPAEVTANGGSAKTTETKDEPLAELGVAPGAPAPAKDKTAPKK
jgi:hypothetical protein